MSTINLSLSAEETSVIQRVRELKMAYWTDAAVPGAQDVYDNALEALMDTVQLCMGDEEGGSK